MRRIIILLNKRVLQSVLMGYTRERNLLYSRVDNNQTPYFCKDARRTLKNVFHIGLVNLKMLLKKLKIYFFFY